MKDSEHKDDILSAAINETCVAACNSKDGDFFTYQIYARAKAVKKQAPRPNRKCIILLDRL